MVADLVRHCKGWNKANVLVKVNSSVRELAERSSLLELGGLLGVLYYDNCSSALPFATFSHFREKVSPPILWQQQQQQQHRCFEIAAHSLLLFEALMLCLPIRRKGDRVRQNKTYVFVSHDRGWCVDGRNSLIDAQVSTSECSSRDADSSYREAGLPLLIFSRRVVALCRKSGDFGDRKKFWCVLNICGGAVC
jgi:hypothetical protein